MINVAIVPAAVSRIPALEAVVDGLPETAHRIGSRISTDPLESGASISDHAQSRPIELRLSGWVSNVRLARPTLSSIPLPPVVQTALENPAIRGVVNEASARLRALPGGGLAAQATRDLADGISPANSPALSNLFAAATHQASKLVGSNVAVGMLAQAKAVLVDSPLGVRLGFRSAEVPPGETEVSRPASAWASILMLNATHEPVEVITPLATYPEMVITNVDAPESAGGLRFTMQLQEVIRVGSSVAGGVVEDRAQGPAIGRGAAEIVGRVTPEPIRDLSRIGSFFPR